MNRRFSKVAVVAFVFGCMGILFSQSRAVGPLVAAIPLGPITICLAAIAFWVIRRKGGMLRGRGLAMWGGTLGAVGTVLSIVSLSGLFAQQFDPDHLQKMTRRRSGLRETATNFTSNLPIVVLRGDPDQASKHNALEMRAEFFDLGPDKRAALARKPEYAGMISIHPRGTSSLQLPKHSFTFHTLDEQTNETNVSLFGLAKDSDWILYAPFEDKTLIRDVLAYQLSNDMGQYAPRTRYVELFSHGSGGSLSMRDYEGVYVLVEKIKRGKSRVNIAKLAPEHNAEPDISGGYIVRRDHGDGSGKRFRTERGGPYFYVSPNERVITREQKAWLTGYFNDFEDALYGADFSDRKKGYAAYLDVDAFIDLHWLIELSKNVDGFRYSSYLTKDRNGKLKAGPAWDWNRSFGNANYYGGWQPQGWYWRNLRSNEISWYARLREDPAFEARCKARWRELRKRVLDPIRISTMIDAYAAQLADAQQRNFKRWPIMGQQVTCNHFVGDSYEEEVNWLKKWIDRRIAWIDKQVAQGSENAEADRSE